MKKIILIALGFTYGISYSQTFTPRIENINTNQFTYQELQKTGCPTPPVNIQIVPDISPVSWDYS